MNLVNIQLIIINCHRENLYRVLKMAYQVPMIEHARILLREEVGLQSCNPSDPSFPSLPTVEELIAGFDSSPDCPRCKHCNGKLLRGSQSLICVYCGREQIREFPPDPISFKYTIGFQWLLDSLGLDGSEIIEPSDEDKQISGGNSVKDGISLSDFLGLEMKWPFESERFGSIDADDLKNHGTGPLQLAGINFTHPFSEEKSEYSSNLPVEQAISNEKSIEFEVRGSRSIDFSENRDLSGIDVKTTEVKNGDTFSAWEADFQYATSVAPIPHTPPTIEENETTYRSNFFSHVSVLERKHDVGSVLEHVEQVLEPNSQSEKELHLGNLKSDDKVKGDGYDSFDSWKDMKSATDIGNAQWVSSSEVVSSSAKISRNDDSSDVWNDFTGFTGSGENKHLTSSINSLKEGISFDAWSDFTSSGIFSDGQLEDRGLNSTEEPSVSVGKDMFGQWNDVTNLKCSEEVQQEVSVKIAASNETANQKDDGLFNLSEVDDKLQNTGKLLTADKINENDEYSFNMWDDFMSSTVVQDNPGDSNSVELAGGQLNDEGDDAVDGWGNFMSLSSSQSKKETDSKETHGDWKIIKNDDLFDSSNDFTSSACIHESISLNEDMTQVWSDIPNPNIQQKIVDQQAPDGVAIVEDDGSWSDFRSSCNAASSKFPSPTDAIINNIASEDFSNQSWNDLSNSTFHPGQDHATQMKVYENDIVKDNDVFNSWGGLQSNKLLNSEARMSEVDGMFNDWSSSLIDSKGTSDNQPKVGGDSVPSVTKISENDDSFDAWSDFTSSTTLPGNQSQNLKESLVDDKQEVTGNDPFDAWSLLMTSSSQSIIQNVTSTEHANETSLLNSSRNQKNLGFDSTLQPDFFPGAANDQNGSASLSISSFEALDLFRIKDGDAKSSIDAEQSQKDENASGQKKRAIDAVTLISQMNDLSFMLENNLSVTKSVE